MKTHVRNIWGGLLFGMILLLGLSAMTVSAATKENGYITFAYGEADSYKQADVTGDGKKDKVEVIDTDSKTTLKVNDKKIKTWNKNKNQNATIRVFKIGKKGFLEITVEDYKKDKNTLGIYTVNGGKLKSVLNYQSLVSSKILIGNKYHTDGGSLDMVSLSKVKGKNVYVTVSLGTKALGQVKIRDLKLTYKGGKFTLAKTPGTVNINIIKDDGNSVSMTDKMTAKTRIALYTAAGSKKSAGISINPNESFRPVKGVVLGKKVYLQVKKTNGSKGWMQLGTSKLVKTPGMLIYG